jgi:glyoxylase-like metal-dependent hydrolase (beta-lactamase superfamily II)
MFLGSLRPALDPAETAAARIAALGFKGADVRHIVLTHLDLDHAGGIGDFPQARIHVMARERDVALAPPSWQEKLRYVQAQWAHGPRWHAYAAGGDRWFGFDSVRALGDSETELLLVPLHGHTRGHAGVAVRTGGGWLLHCGDAYFFHGETDPHHPHCTPGLKLFQRFVEIDHAARVGNQARLRELRRDHGGEVRLFCAHDPDEFAGFAA